MTALGASMPKMGDVVTGMWSMSITLYMFDIDVWSSLTGSTASTLVQYNTWWLGSYQENWACLKISSNHSVVMEWWWVRLPLSIAYEACQSPYICLTLMCDQVWLDLEPQPLCNTTVGGWAVTKKIGLTWKIQTNTQCWNTWWLGSYQENRAYLKISSKHSVVMEWWWVCLPLSIAYEACQLPYICLTLMCDQVWLDIQPQPLYNTP